MGEFTPLVGLKRIAIYLKRSGSHRSQKTLSRDIRKLGMPATKIGKFWFASGEALDKWFLEFLENKIKNKNGRLD